MIGIITYISVLERTMEIGVLRSLGAQKKDISSVFSAEAVIIGAASGELGVTLAYLLTVPMNFIINRITGVIGIANLTPTFCTLLILGSMMLTLIAGICHPNSQQKNPVAAAAIEMIVILTLLI